MLFFNLIFMSVSIFLTLFTMVGLIKHQPETPFYYFRINTICMFIGCMGIGLNTFFIIRDIQG